MEQLELEVTARTEKGKNEARRMRASGIIPGIIYGSSEKSVAISVKELLLTKLLKKGENVIVNLKVKHDSEVASKTAIIKEIQHDPVTGKIIHADFHLISLKKKIEIKVSLAITGDSIGIQRGGIVEYHIREIPIRCLPTAIPAHIDVDIGTLNIGDSVHVKNLRVAEGIEILLPKDEVIVTITPPSELKEEAPAATAAAPTEPEVIGEKEREERRAAKETGKETKEEKKKEEPKAKTS